MLVSVSKLLYFEMLQHSTFPIKCCHSPVWCKRVVECVFQLRSFFSIYCLCQFIFVLLICYDWQQKNHCRLHLDTSISEERCYEVQRAHLLLWNMIESKYSSFLCEIKYVEFFLKIVMTIAKVIITIVFSLSFLLIFMGYLRCGSAPGFSSVLEHVIWWLVCVKHKHAPLEWCFVDQILNPTFTPPYASLTQNNSFLYRIWSFPSSMPVYKMIIVVLVRFGYLIQLEFRIVYIM